MNKDLVSISLRWGGIIAVVQILSHFLLVYAFSNMSDIVKQVTEIITLLVTLYLLYCSIRDYRQKHTESPQFTLLQGFVVALFSCLIFVGFFTFYFLILTSFIDPNFIDKKNVMDHTIETMQNNGQGITRISYLSKYVNSYLIFQLTAALFMAAIMQRKEKINESKDKVENK